MANAAPRRTELDHLATIRLALANVLPSVPEVDAAYVTVEGPYVTVRAFVPEASLAIAEQLVDAAERLEELVPGSSFDVFPRSHQGRGARAASGGSEPDYERPRA